MAAGSVRLARAVVEWSERQTKLGSQIMHQDIESAARPQPWIKWVIGNSQNSLLSVMSPTTPPPFNTTNHPLFVRPDTSDHGHLSDVTSHRSRAKILFIGGSTLLNDSFVSEKWVCSCSAERVNLYALVWWNFYHFQSEALSVLSWFSGLAISHPTNNRCYRLSIIKSPTVWYYL